MGLSSYSPVFCQTFTLSDLQTQLQIYQIYLRPLMSVLAYKTSVVRSWQILCTELQESRYFCILEHLKGEIFKGVGDCSWRVFCDLQSRGLKCAEHCKIRKLIFLYLFCWFALFFKKCVRYIIKVWLQKNLIFLDISTFSEKNILYYFSLTDCNVPELVAPQTFIICRCGQLKSCVSTANKSPAVVNIPVIFSYKKKSQI